MSAVSLEERVRRYLDKIPGAISGSGGHNQTFTAACALIKGFDLSVDEARPFMHLYNQRCEPPWTEQQLEHKLITADNAKDAQPRGWLSGNADEESSHQHLPRSAAPNAKPKAIFQPAKLTTFAAGWKDKVNTPWLADRSPIEPALCGPLDLLAELYAEGERVIIFTDKKSQGQAIWPDEPIPNSGPDGVLFLCQPVDGRKHPNPRTGKFSRRSEESVTAWRYLVVESDEADMRDWMGALVQLPLRIAAIYTSGKRSIHALVRVDGGGKAEWDLERDHLKNPLIVLGADPKALSAVRLTRLPGCTRAGRPQKLLYFNPSPAAVPICELPRVRDTLGYWLGVHQRLIGVVQTPDDERMPAGFLTALDFYARTDSLCETAANYWRKRLSPPVADEQTDTR